MKHLKNRYNNIMRAEKLVVPVFAAALVIAQMIIPDTTVARLLVSLALGGIAIIVELKIISASEEKIQEEFFLEGCKNGRNVLHYEKIRLSSEAEEELCETFKGKVPRIMGIFFEDISGAYSIQIAYEKWNTREFPYFAEEIMGSRRKQYEVRELPLVDLKEDLDYYLEFAG